MRINQETRAYFEIGDREDLSYLEKLGEYRRLADEYFEANGKIVCGSCRVQVQQARGGGSKVRRVARALAAGLVAVVLSALAFTKLTVPGPLNLDQVVVRMPLGKPSSVAVPERLAPAGSVMV